MLTDPATDFIELWFYAPDFDTPANTMLSGPLDVEIAEFNSNLCSSSPFACFPQAGTSTKLDAVREVVMFPFAYRNFAAYESLLGNLVTDTDGTDHGGIRWFELRRSLPAGAWIVHQEGTYAPDGHHRWLGSSRMDGAGNIALGYSVSSTSMFPAMRVTGRLAGDPAGMMTLAELSLLEGTGHHSSNRWGDYSSMSVDPSDDCTFWHTNMSADTDHRWVTHVATFRFAECVLPDADGDGVTNGQDNCLEVANPTQCDHDGDLYGNHCDADFNQNGIVNFDDLGVMKASFLSDNPLTDLDCNGVVNFADLGMMRQLFFAPPGPSGRTQ